MERLLLWDWRMRVGTVLIDSPSAQFAGAVIKEQIKTIPIRDILESSWLSSGLIKYYGTNIPALSRHASSCLGEKVMLSVLLCASTNSGLD